MRLSLWMSFGQEHTSRHASNRNASEKRWHLTDGGGNNSKTDEKTREEIRYRFAYKEQGSAISSTTKAHMKTFLWSGSHNLNFFNGHNMPGIEII
jgi:hypothetical protein